MTSVTRAQDNAGGDRDGAGLPRVPSIPLSDEKTVAAAEAADASIGGLVKDATIHLSTLVRAEVELAKQELVGEAKKAGLGVALFLVALVLVLLALPWLLTAAALGINKGLWDWAQPWGGFLIVGLLKLVLAGVGVFIGVRKFKKIKAPERTISTMKDTAAALRHHGADDAPVAP